MLNIPDPWVAAAFLLSVGSALLCVGWGLLRWRRADSRKETEEEVARWAREENQVEKEL